MKKGLFINQKKTQCSIYESGLMIYNTLKTNANFELDYIETTHNFTTNEPYDFCVVNWHHITLSFNKAQANALPGLKIGINLEVSPQNCIPYMPGDIFNAYMIIDPTKNRDRNFYPFPRPLEIVPDLRELLSENKMVVGAFGFCGNNDKRFDEIIEYFNASGEECIIRFNFPAATYMPNNHNFIVTYAQGLRSKVRSKNIDLRITHDYMDKQELVRWCSEHAINAFPYYRNIPGLAAVTDQAISAGRPIAISNCSTFRHMFQYISYFPQQNYRELIASTPEGIKQMQEDWSAERFNARFNELLIENRIL